MVRALQKSYPNAKITWITSKAAYQILAGLSGVDFIIIDKPKSLQDYYRFWQQMRAFHFDVLLAMQASLRANLMYPLIRAKRKIGFDAIRAKDAHQWFVCESIPFKEQHLLESFLSFADTIGADTSQTPSWQLDISQEYYDWVDVAVSQPFITINPAASKVERNWPVENYIRLIQQLQSKYAAFQIVLTGGPNDTVLTSHIAEQTGAISIAGKTTLKQLAALLDKAALLIAPDTGPAHIATAMNTPVIGLYAVITAKLSGPYLSQHLTIDKYPQAVKTYLHQDPNSIKWGTRVHHSKAMSLIDVEEVMAVCGSCGF